MGKTSEEFMRQRESEPRDLHAEREERIQQEIEEWKERDKDLIISLEKCNLVFVYGTLRKGHGNNRLLRNSTYLGRSTTSDKYAMYGVGCPIVSDQKEVSKIIGEVYKIDEECLANLDRLEGHPDFYKRKVINITLDDNNNQLSAWIYICNRIYYTETLIESGDYNDYESPGFGNNLIRY